MSRYKKSYVSSFKRRIRDTPFKKKLASLEVGTSVRITAPLEKFVLHDDHSKAAVFLSGGIGVFPTSIKLKVKYYDWISYNTMMRLFTLLEYTPDIRANLNIPPINFIYLDKNFLLWVTRLTKPFMHNR
jgi:hypothetical protein